MIVVLAKDINLYSDGGSQGVAYLKPLHGAAKVAGFLRAIHRRTQKLSLKYSLKLIRVNGQPEIIHLLGNKLESVVTIEITNDRIQGLYFMRNPNKLK